MKRLSVIVPSLTGEVPSSVRALGTAVELVVVKGVSPVAAARNEGLRRATGDYVAWVDADDEITDRWYPAIRAVLDQPDPPDVISFKARVEWRDGSRRPAYELSGAVPGQLWLRVFRRSLFDGLSFVGAIHEDWRIQCQMPRNLRCTHIDEPLYVYCRTTSGLSQHAHLGAELKALFGLLLICRSPAMFAGICARFYDLAKTPFRRLRATCQRGPHG